jgi:hypothetical protein
LFARQLHDQRAGLTVDQQDIGGLAQWLIAVQPEGVPSWRQALRRVIRLKPMVGASRR